MDALPWAGAPGRDALRKLPADVTRRLSPSDTTPLPPNGQLRRAPTARSIRVS